MQRRGSLLKSTKGRLSESEVAHLDRLLDEALRETFPASDPVAITIDGPSKAVCSEVPRRLPQGQRSTAIPATTP